VSTLWNRFWFEAVDGTPLGLTRIGVACAGLVLWAGTLPLLRHFYSDQGEFPIAAARGWSAEYIGRYLMPDALGTIGAVAVLFALWGLALAALLVGWRTRVAAWATWLLTAWFLLRTPTFTNGGDEVFRLVTLYLAAGYSVIPVPARALSVDRWLWRRGSAGDAEPLVPAWTVRMVQVQISVVYFVAGFWKVVAPPWHDGSALAYALGNATFSRFGVPHWAWAHPLFLALTVTVAWWEFLFPVLAFGRHTRRASLAFGVCMHAMILVLMNIGIFPLIMLGCYPAFLKGGEARSLVAAFSGDRARRPGPATAQPSASSSASAPSGVDA